MDTYKNLFVGENDLSSGSSSTSLLDTSILLIDASGSVRSDFVDGLTIFDKFVKIIESFPEAEHRVLFWNSDRTDKAGTFFTNGIYKIPFVVKQNSQINQLCKLVKENINQYCLTFPHLGLDAVPNEWFTPNKKVKVRLITDGQIGWNNCGMQTTQALKKDLLTAINKLFTSHPNTQFEIIAVESQIRDFTNIETLNNAAGCDVFDVIQMGNLTKKITKFISYTPNNTNGFVHIKNRIPLPGHIPYADKDFTVMNIPLFIKYMTNEIKSNKDNEDVLLKIIQDLSHTLTVLTADKPANVRTHNINIFSDMFKNTQLDPLLVNMMLTDAVEKASMGKAQVFASYRNNLKNLYKEANNMLVANVKHSTGMQNDFMTFAYNNVPIITGPSKLVEYHLTIQGKKYMTSAVAIDGILIPALATIEGNDLPPLMNQQCMRQWVRAVIGKLYNVNAMDDVVIHVVLALTLQTVLSDCDTVIVDYYRNLCKVMLNKKRLNSDKTEAENILSGNLPVPNDGQISKLSNDLKTVMNIIGLKVEPLTMWYLMCISLKNDDITASQIGHCYESIKKDFPGFINNDHHNQQNLLNHIKSTQSSLKKVNTYQIPFTMCLDYTCPITLSDTSEEGGWMINSHQNNSNLTCSPTFVMSHVGYNDFIKNDNTRMCPYCYTFLTIEQCTLVPKKTVITDTIKLDKSTDDIFKSHQFPQQQLSQTHVSAPVANSQTASNDMNSTNILIILKGTVGAGKSTIGKTIQDEVHKLGGVCCVEGTDKYRKIGHSAQQAAQMVKDAFIQTKNDSNQLKVVVIDTCGEGNTSGDMFGVSFPQNLWKRIEVTPNYLKDDAKGYLYWSLRNVLRRKQPKTEDNHYLEPISAGLDVCLTVHKKKAISLFGKNKYVDMFTSMPVGIDDAIGKLNQVADLYETKLDQVLSLDKQTNDIVSKIVKFKNSKMQANQSN